MLEKDITFLIVAHNSQQVILNCLQGISGYGGKIIVVDNASTDGSVETALEFSNQIQVIKQKNIGYGNAANIGILASDTSYVLLINPDVIVSEQAINSLLSAIHENADIAIVAPKLYTLQNGKQVFTKKSDANENISFVDWVSGAAMLMDKAKIQNLGGFDENIFLFYEETDLFKRVLQHGYKIALCGNAVAQHEMGTSSPPTDKNLKIKFWHMGWSKAYFDKKHSGAIAMAAEIVKCLLVYGGKAIFAKCSVNHKKYIKYSYKLRGLFAYIIGQSAFNNDGSGKIT